MFYLFVEVISKGSIVILVYKLIRFIFLVFLRMFFLGLKFCILLLNIGKEIG